MINIRLLRKDEIKKVSQLVSETNNYSKQERTYSEYKFSGMFKNKVKKPAFLIAEEKGELKGCVGYAQSSMNSLIYELFLVNVHPKYQSSGIGTELISRAISNIKSKKGYEKASLVLLTTPKPDYYNKKFGFKTLMRFRNGKAHLMFIDLKDSLK